MRASVVVFPGSNAEGELARALGLVLGVAPTLVWHRERELPQGTDLVALPGGFAHGDHLRCGALARSSPISGAILHHAMRGGLVLGVCNGFQILTELGLLPGALLQNAHRRFECRDVFVRVEREGPFTPHRGAVLRLPIAHGEGRFHLDREALSRLEDAEGVALRYCDGSGEISPEANPNGSVHGIAGIYGGPARNVLGLMPHPERRTEPLHGGTDGRAFFDAARLAVAAL
ncbi:MAG: phosphoribosylformylglycinamidine synthase subunit PurQ [Myxococcota bacterium]